MRLARRRELASVSSPARVSERSLQAAGYRVKRRDAQTLLRLRQLWQARAFYFYDVIPELKFAAQFYARMLEPLRLYVQKQGDDGEWVEIRKDETTDEADLTAIAQLDRVQDPGGGRTGLLGGYGRLMFIAGEAMLFCTRDPETDLEQWEMLSTDEIRVMDGQVQRNRAPALIETYEEPSDDDWEPLDERSAIAYRLWRRHPRFSELPDATMMGVLDVAEQMEILAKAIRARGLSRLAGPGIVFLDSRISPLPAEPAPDDDPAEDPLMADIIAAISAAIADQGEASAMAPVLVRVPVPPESTRSLADMIYHLQITDPTQLYPETGLLIESTKRLAIGLDMPPEILLGIGDANHWSGWAIEDQTWKAHGLPLAKWLTGDLTQAFFRPSLEAAGVEEWWRYSVGFDESAIVVHPDRSKDARDAFNDGELSGEAYRRELDFSEDDAPSEEERNRWLGVKIRDGSLAVYGIPSVRSGGIEPEAGELESGAGTESAPTTGAEVTPGPPRSSDVAPDEALAAAMLVARIQGAVDLAVLRAREAAGNRVVSLAKRDPAARRRIDGVATALVPARLGRDAVRALRAPTDVELVAGCADLVADTLRLWGITDAKVIELVTSSVEEHAARTLYMERPPRIPDSFAEYVSGLLASRNGHGDVRVL